MPATASRLQAAPNRIKPCADWDYEQMIRRLKQGQYAAIISDDVQLIPRAHQDKSCALHILDEQIEPFDLAIAYRKGFPFPRLQAEISNSLLRLQEAGTLEVCSSVPSRSSTWTWRECTSDLAARRSHRTTCSLARASSAAELRMGRRKSSRTTCRRNHRAWSPRSSLRPTASTCKRCGGCGSSSALRCS